MFRIGTRKVKETKNTNSILVSNYGNTTVKLDRPEISYFADMALTYEEYFEVEE